MVKARFAASSPVAAGKNRPMTVRERQHLHLQLTKMEEINTRAPGSVYSLDTEVTPRGLRLRFIWNRDSGTGGAAAQPPADADKAKAAGVPAAPTQGHKPGPATPARPPSAPKGKPTGKPSAQPRDDSRDGRSTAEADAPMPTARPPPPLPPVAAADSEISEKEAVGVRDLIAHKVGGVVHALGGDSETGDELLCEKQLFTLGSHKTRGVRLPKGSRASDMSALKFNQTVETIYGKVRGVSRSSNVWQTHMIALDHLLKPQEKPMDVDDATKGLASVQVSSPRPETGG